MRKIDIIPIILGFTLLAVLTIMDAYNFLVTDDGVRYFVSEPTRLFYVVAIALVGGGLALAFSRLSPITRRKLTLLTLGCFAACATGFAVFLVICLVSFSTTVAESGNRRWIIVALGSLIVVAMLIWFEFYQFWRRGKSRATNF
jgi:ABC-type Fe3+-siderophore transport system permease subunit